MMKRLCVLLLLGAFSLRPAQSAEAGVKSAKPWNFLVILLDDAGWRDVGFAGNTFVETPHLDGLARQGVRFSTAYATHAFCTSSRQSLVTGQWPARTAWTQRSEVRHPDAPNGAPPYSLTGHWPGRGATPNSSASPRR